MAKVTLRITLDDDTHPGIVQKAINAFTGAAGRNIEIEIEGDENFPPTHISGQYGAKKPAESPRDFGERVATRLVLGFIRCWSRGLDSVRYGNDIKALSPVSDGIPDDAIIPGDGT